MSVTVFQELRIRAQLDPLVRRKLAAYPLQFLADFDLSFDEKRQIVLPQFSWVLEDRLAAMPFPLTEDAYVVLQQLGIKVILNLTGYLDDAPLLSAFNVYHIPIANHKEWGHKPPTLEQMHQAISIIQASLSASFLMRRIYRKCDTYSRLLGSRIGLIYRTQSRSGGAQISGKNGQPGFRHFSIPQQARNSHAIGLRPGTFSAARRKPAGISIAIDALNRAVNPTKAKRLLNRLLVRDASFPRRFLIVNQPDLLFLLVVLRQPHPPLLSARNQQRFTNIHEEISLSCIQLVGFRRHYEIVAVQTTYFVRPPCHRHFAPLRQQGRMVALRLGKRADFIGEIQRLDKIGEGKHAFQAVNA